MPKLLQLNVTANWGSTGKIAEGIGVAAIARGWESAIAFGRMQNSSASKLIKVGNQFDVYYHYALNRLFDAEGRGSRAATKRLIDKIERFSPDIVHLHNIHDHWLCYPVLLDFLKGVGVKVVWTFHDCWAFTGGCPHFVAVGCNAWKTECAQCRLPRAVLDNTTYNFRLKETLIKALGNNLTLVSVSHWLDSMVAESVLNELKHLVIYNGVDTSVFSPQPVDEINRKYSLFGKIVLLGVSSVWSEGKGLNDYFALRQRLPDTYVIILVGLSPKQIKALPSGIIGIPRTDSAAELAALYTRANAVMCLSKAETFGLTLVEGWACGTPSIGYADTAVKELLTPDVGIAVTPGNLDELVQAAISLSDNTVFDPEICRSRVEVNFNRHKQYNKYIDLYETLI